jgi:hypothetical protein
MTAGDSKIAIMILQFPQGELKYKTDWLAQKIYSLA